MNKKLIGYLLATLAILGGANTQATNSGLTAITINGNKMVNDSTLGVTWADNSAAAYTMNYSQSIDYIAALNSTNYGGHSDWLIAQIYSTDGSHTYYCDSIGDCSSTPTIQSFSPSACQSGYVDLRCLFVYELSTTGNEPSFNPFSSLSTGSYWGGTASGYYNKYIGYTAEPSCLHGKPGDSQCFHPTWTTTTIAYYKSFDLQSGLDTISTDGSVARYTLAYRVGLTDSAPVPVPASTWLLLSGLGGLGLLNPMRKIKGAGVTKVC